MTYPNINVWPQLGTTVTLAGGYVITAAGAVAAKTPEIDNLLRSPEKLLTNDPTGVNPNPSPIPSTPGGGGGSSITFATVAALQVSISPETDGITAELLGYYNAGDTGNSTVRWNAASTQTVDNFMCFKGASATGRWFRVWNGQDLYVDWAGCKREASGSTDDYALIMKALNLSPLVCTVHLSPGVYRTTDIIRMPIGKTLRGAMPGQAGPFVGAPASQASSIIEYIGPNRLAASDAVIRLASSSALRCVEVRPGVGTRVTAGIGFSSFYDTVNGVPNTQVFVTTAYVSDVRLNCFAGGWGDKGYFDYGVVIGATSTGQADFLIWDRGCIDDAIRSAILFAGGQPFGTQFNDVIFFNRVGFEKITPYFAYGTSTAGAVSHGTIITYDAGFGDVVFNNPRIEFYATFFRGFTSAQHFLTVNNPTWEGCRRLWYQIQFGKSWLPVAFNGGRFSHIPEYCNKTVYEADGTTIDIGPSDRRFIYDRGGNVFNLRGCNFTDSVTNSYENGWLFRLGHHSTLNAEGCTFPNLTMVDREFMGHEVTSGGTFIRGCRGMAVSLNGTLSTECPYPDRNGAENPDGWVSISGASTSAVVTLPVGEWGIDAFDGPTGVVYAPRIQIEAFVTRASSSAAAGAYKVRVNPTWDPTYNATTQFTVTLDAAPGTTSADWVVVSYRLSIQRQGIQD